MKRICYQVHKHIISFLEITCNAATQRYVDGGYELAFSMFTNIVSHCLWQLQADKVFDCTVVQVNDKRLPAFAPEPPTRPEDG